MRAHQVKQRRVLRAIYAAVEQQAVAQQLVGRLTCLAQACSPGGQLLVGARSHAAAAHGVGALRGGGAHVPPRPLRVQRLRRSGVSALGL